MRRALTEDNVMVQNLLLFPATLQERETASKRRYTADIARLPLPQKGAGTRVAADIPLLQATRIRAFIGSLEVVIPPAKVEEHRAAFAIWTRHHLTLVAHETNEAMWKKSPAYYLALSLALSAMHS